MRLILTGLACSFLLGPALRAQDSDSAALAKKQRTRLVHALRQVADRVDKQIGTRTLAVLDFKAVADDAEAAEAAKHLQSQVIQAIWSRGVIAFNAERYRAVTITRGEDGRLPSGRLYSNADADYFRKEKKAHFILQGRIQRGTSQGWGGGSGFTREKPVTEEKEEKKPSSYGAACQIFDLRSGRVVDRFVLPSLNPEGTSFAEICSKEWLPYYNCVIMDFVSGNIGESIGSGECWDVPGTALKNVGLRIRSYNFGTRVDWKDALPGDVVTSDSHVMVLIRPNKRGGGTILHQNVGGKRYIVHGNVSANHVVWRPGEPDPRFGSGKGLLKKKR